MASLAEVNFKLTANVEEFQTAMRKAEKSFKAFGDNMKKIGTTLSLAFTAPVVALGAASLKMAGSVEQTQKTFEVLLKSADGAKKMIEDLQKFSADTPYEFMNTKDIASGLIAVGVAAKDVIPTLTHLGDLSMGDPEKFQRLSEAYEKMKAKGKADMEQLNRFTEAGVPIVEALAKNFKATNEQVFKLSEKGKITFEDINNSIISLTTNGGKFEGMMKKQNSSITGLFSNFMDTISNSAAKFGMAISNALNLKDLIPRISGWIQGLSDAFSNLNPGAQKFIVIVTGIVAAIGPLLLAIGFFSTNIIPVLTAGIGVAINVMGGLATAFKAASLVVATNPIGAAVAAIGVAMLATYAAVQLFGNAHKDSAVSVDKFRASLLTETSKMDELFRLTKATTEGSGARKKMIDEINKAYGDYLPKLLTEKSSLQEIAQAQRIATSALMANIAAKAKEADLTQAFDKSNKKSQGLFENIGETVGGSDQHKNAAQAEVMDFLKYNKTITDVTGNTSFNSDRIAKFALKMSKKYGGSDSELYSEIMKLSEAQIELSKSIDQTSKFYDGMIGKSTAVANASSNLTGKTVEQMEADEKAKEAAKKLSDQGLGVLADKEREIEALRKKQVNTDNPALIKSIQDRIEWVNTEIEIMKKYGQTAAQFFGMSKKEMDRMAITPMTAKGPGQVTFNKDGKSPTSGLGLSTFTESLTKAEQAFRQFIDSANQMINDFLKNGIASIGEGIANMITGTGSLSDLFSPILSSIGSFLKQLGTLMISFGVGMEAFKKSIATLNPFVAIIAGVALVAAGSLVTSLAGKGPKGFANGGIVPGSSLSGDLVPIRVNSGEMILNRTQQAKLFEMANGRGMVAGTSGEVVFRISGDTLLGVLNNHSRKINNRG